ncbi:hypothetical protein SMICM304S_07441 [Streptomyces microflavus]
MDPILDELRTTPSALAPQSPAIDFYTTVFDDARRNVPLDADYWTANQRRPVLFLSAIRAAVEDGHRRFLEISPHPVLTHAVQSTVDSLGGDPADVLASLHRDTDEATDFLTQVASLHCTGHPVDSHPRYGAGGLADPPGMSWERTRHVIDPSPPEGHDARRYRWPSTDRYAPEGPGQHAAAHLAEDAHPHHPPVAGRAPRQRRARPARCRLHRDGHHLRHRCVRHRRAQRRSPQSGSQPHAAATRSGT